MVARLSEVVQQADKALTSLIRLRCAAPYTTIVCPGSLRIGYEFMKFTVHWKRRKGEAWKR